MRRCLLLILLLLPTLAGCAPRVALDRGQAERVRTIGLVEPAMPEGPSAPIILAPGIYFGLVGGLIEAAMQEERDQRIRAAIAARGFEVRARFAAHLDAELRAAGFRTVPVAADRARRDLLAAYPPAEVDAYLDIHVQQFGYAARTTASPFRPFLMLTTRLAAPDGRALFQEGFTLNWGSDTLITRDRPGPEGHDIAASTEFDANPDRTLAGLDAGLAEMARHIVAALR